MKKQMRWTHTTKSEKSRRRWNVPGPRLWLSTLASLHFAYLKFNRFDLNMSTADWLRHMQEPCTDEYQMRSRSYLCTYYTYWNGADGVCMGIQCIAEVSVGDEKKNTYNKTHTAIRSHMQPQHLCIRPVRLAGHMPDGWRFFFYLLFFNVIFVLFL